VAISTLVDKPFSLQYGDRAVTIVSASDGVTISDLSLSGGAAYIMTYPDPPTNFQYNRTLTDATAPKFNGGF
jgi:hypothetical protein